MLKIENLHVSYGGIRALRGISLEVPDGKIVTLIGANGAGKSTTLRTISGLVKADSGSITYDGKSCWESRSTRSWKWASPRFRRGGACSQISRCVKT